MPLEHGGFDVVAARQVTRQLVGHAAGEDLGALLLADVDVRQYFLVLIIRRLCTDLRTHVVRIALANCFDAFHGALHEAIVNGLLDHQQF